MNEISKYDVARSIQGTLRVCGLKHIGCPWNLYRAGRQSAAYVVVIFINVCRCKRRRAVCWDSVSLLCD